MFHQHCFTKERRNSHKSTSRARWPVDRLNTTDNKLTRRALICVCSIAVDNKNEKHVKTENLFESIGIKNVFECI